jgi:hypothetical protein
MGAADSVRDYQEIVHFGHFAELTTALELEQFIALENTIPGSRKWKIHRGSATSSNGALRLLADAPHGRTLAIMLANGSASARGGHH